MVEERVAGPIQTIHPSNFEGVNWFLSPSKSHMIRWLVLASMSKDKTRISFDGKPGEDIHSMANCLEKMGIVIKREKEFWEIQGNGPHGFSIPNEVLDCRNSGTTMRFLIPQLACFSSSAVIDGDWTLRNRHLESSTN